MLTSGDPVPALHPDPPLSGAMPGFDAGIDTDALRVLIDGYVASQAIGCPNPPRFGKLTAARISTCSLHMCVSYTTISTGASDAPRFALGPGISHVEHEHVVYVDGALLSVYTAPPV